MVHSSKQFVHHSILSKPNFSLGTFLSLLCCRRSGSLRKQSKTLCVSLLAILDYLSNSITWRSFLDSPHFHRVYHQKGRFTSRGPFLEGPETFRVHFGCHKSLCTFKTTLSRGANFAFIYILIFILLKHMKRPV